MIFRAKRFDRRLVLGYKSYSLLGIFNDSIRVNFW
jgi:hypothetical protein